MVFPNTFLSCTASAAHSRILKSCRHLKKIFRDLVLRQPLSLMPALVDTRPSAPGRLEERPSFMELAETEGSRFQDDEVKARKQCLGPRVEDLPWKGPAIDGPH